MSSTRDLHDDRAIGAITCLVLTTPLVPVWALYALDVLDSYLLSNMPFWMLPVVAISILAAFPVALIAVLLGRFIQTSRFSVVVMSVATMLAVVFTPDLAAAVASATKVTGSPKSVADYFGWILLFTLVPVCFGMLVSCVAPRILPEPH